MGDLSGNTISIITFSEVFFKRILTFASFQNEELLLIYCIGNRSYDASIQLPEASAWSCLL